MSFININKSHEDDTLCAIKSNVLHTFFSPTSAPGATSMTGTLTFNHIHPPSKHVGIKNVKINFSGTFAITTSAAITNFRIMNINDCLHTCLCSINSSVSTTQQPFVNAEIKRSYDKDWWVDDQVIKSDKFVSYELLKNSDTSYTLTYNCAAPLCHTYLEQEIVGIHSLDITTQVNLFGILRTSPTAAGISLITALTVSNAKYQITYDRVNYNTTKDVYNTQVQYYNYYQSDAVQNFAGTAGGLERTSQTINVRDVNGCPLTIYVGSFNDIRADQTVLCTTSVPYQFNSISYNINSKQNVYNTNSSNEIYNISRSAGCLDEYNIFNGNRVHLAGGAMTIGSNAGFGVGLKSIAAINLMNYQSNISSNDIFRFDISFGYTLKDITAATASACTQVCFAVFNYPDLLTLSDISNIDAHVVSGSISELVESDVSDDYVSLLDNNGFAVGGGGEEGSGKFLDWIKGAIQKLKEGKYISKALHFVNNVPFVDKIPVVGPWIKPVASKVGDLAEKYGFGNNGMCAAGSVNMF